MKIHLNVDLPFNRFRKIGLKMAAVTLIFHCQFLSAQILNQTEIGPNGCGPCAAINSLTQANQKDAIQFLDGDSQLEHARSFIQKYGGADSIPYDKRRPAYSDAKGSTDRDLLAMLNQLAKDSRTKSFSGDYVLREDQATAREFIAKFQKSIHDSIEQNFHPILSIRALAAEYNESRKQHVWNSKGGHWIAIHSVSDLSEDGRSISIEFSDSLSGQRQTGFIFFNQSRPASVPMQFTVDESGKEVWQWKSNQQTLELVAPGMALGTTRAKWNERAFIAIRFLIVREGQPTSKAGQTPNQTR